MNDYEEALKQLPEFEEAYEFEKSQEIPHEDMIRLLAFEIQRCKDIIEENNNE